MQNSWHYLYFIRFLENTYNPCTVKRNILVEALEHFGPVSSGVWMSEVRKDTGLKVPYLAINKFPVGILNEYIVVEAPIERRICTRGFTATYSGILKFGHMITLDITSVTIATKIADSDVLSECWILRLFLLDSSTSVWRGEKCDINRVKNLWSENYI